MKRVILLAALFVSGCGSATPGVAATPVVLTEGSITVVHRTLAAGRVSLEIGNKGQYDHTLVVTTDAGVVVAATGLIAAGTTTNLDVDLAPGGYQFSCRIVAVDGDGAVVDHYQLGMKAEVRVRAG